MAGATARGGPHEVVITGDITHDWHIARVVTEAGPGWDDQTVSSYQLGGVNLLISVMTALSKKLKSFEVRAPAPPAGLASPQDKRYHHSFAEWRRHRKTPGEKEMVWRVSELLGVDYGKKTEAQAGADKPNGDPASAKVVVLDDADMGFRSDEKSWPESIVSGTPEWVVVKTTRSIANGALWESLLKRHADRLIVVMTVNDLRNSRMQISRALSWERTAQDILAEVGRDSELESLRRCAHLVISFHTAGALLLSRLDGSSCRLYFDPHVVEREWRRSYPGRMIGYTTCLTAGIVRELVQSKRSDARETIGRGIERGIAGMRRLHIEGYGDCDSPRGPEFPDKVVAGAIEKGMTLAMTEVPPRLPSDAWTILKERKGEDLFGLAAKIVKQGPGAALSDVPLGKFGALLTVDRHEIEGFRSIRSLIEQYSQQERPPRPLSIAVFGPPGAGKSFGVTEVATSASDRIEQLTFNLSQLNDANDLIGALHQVRNVGISGKLPLVFWDEFDTNELAWLRHFLAPMQDGRFQSEQVTHRVGPAVFVFAGGTAASLADFDEANARQVKLKVPDFLSRLKGFVDISGPDPRNANHEDDPYFVVRRALMLRSIFERSHPNLLGGPDGKLVRIDEGVLTAFLDVTCYRHGVRSMESIVSMSALHGEHQFQRWALPAKPQLDLHVSAEEFFGLVHGGAAEVE